MKNLIFAFFLFISTCLYAGEKLQASVIETYSVVKKQVFNNNEPIEGHKYEIVYEDGLWWIYEYNEDGELVNIYPLDD